MFPKLKRGMGVVAHPWLRSETGHRLFGQHRVTVRGGHRAPVVRNTEPKMGEHRAAVEGTPRPRWGPATESENTAPVGVRNYSIHIYLGPVALDLDSF